jgi:hypothetical protein
MVNATRRELRAAGVAELPEVVVADAGYWHRVQMQALAGDGIQVLIRPTPTSEKAPGRAGTVACTRSCDECWGSVRGSVWA